MWAISVFPSFPACDSWFAEHGGWTRNYGLRRGLFTCLWDHSVCIKSKPWDTHECAWDIHSWPTCGMDQVAQVQWNRSKESTCTGIYLKVNLFPDMCCMYLLDWTECLWFMAFTASAIKYQGQIARRCCRSWCCSFLAAFCWGTGSSTNCRGCFTWKFGENVHLVDAMVLDLAILLLAFEQSSSWHWKLMWQARLEEWRCFNQLWQAFVLES